MKLKKKLLQMSHLEKPFLMEITLSTISAQWVVDYELTPIESFVDLSSDDVYTDVCTGISEHPM